MKTIESDRLLEKIVKLEASSTANFGERTLAVDGSNVIELTDDHEKQIECAIFDGLSAFGALENTLAMKVIGLPTAIARVDSTIDPETGAIHVYEVEERPAGMGHSDKLMRKVTGLGISDQIIDHFEDVFQTVPVVKKHPLALENDDALIFNVEELSPNRIACNGRPLLIRAEPSDMVGHPMISEATSMAVAPILEKGKRQYRISTKMASLVTNYAMLPQGSIVVKTLQGSKAKGVAIHITKNDSAILGSNRDSVTQTKLKQIVESEGAVLVEPFVPGIPTEITDGIIGRMILRIFALVGGNDVRVIGGAYVARPGHLVHGSKDAVSGVIMASKKGI